MIARLDEAIAAFDQPSMDGINTYFVSWAARQAGLKVALSGLGSDELFGGYSPFRSTAQVSRAAAAGALLPEPLRALAAAGIAHQRLRLLPDSSRKGSAAFLDPNASRIRIFSRACSSRRRRSLALRDDSASWDASLWWRWLSDSSRQSRSMDGFTGISWLELRSYLLNTLLRDTDAMSMHHSLEVRVPFLDAPLVEYVLALPESAKRDARPKALIDALGDLLPEEIVTSGNAHSRFRGNIGCAARSANASRPDSPNGRPLLNRSSWRFRASRLEGLSRRPHNLVAPLESLRPQ